MATNIIMAVILDFVIGDPYNFPHPVKLMGHIISLQEKYIRKLFKTHRGLKIGGLLIVLANSIIGFIIPFALLRWVEGYETLYNILSVYLIYTCLSARSLHYEAKKVYMAIGKGIKHARLRLSYIVGRDTKNLNKEDIIKATVETVAENTSDGIIAPLFLL